MYNVVFLGAPGSGKGTQGDIVARRLGLAHLATGDLFRAAVEDGGELGQRVGAYMARGELVPDEITIAMLLSRLRGLGEARGVILDGFPRNVAQARALETALAATGEGIARVVYINVAPDELVRRLSGRWVCRRCQAPYNFDRSQGEVPPCSRCGGELYQRPDDASETVKERLSVYLTRTAPLIDYYRGQGKLVEVSGAGSVEEVTGRIVATLQGVPGGAGR